MDFVKIQYEQPFPASTLIGNAVIGRTHPHYSEEFFEAPIPVVEGPVKAAGSEALVIITLHSPFMWAAHLALHKTLEDAYATHNKLPYGCCFLPECICRSLQQEIFMLARCSSVLDLR
jgi:hypothetical protein